MTLSKRDNAISDINDYFDRFGLGTLLNDSREITSPEWNPRVDIKENKESYLLKAELPGVSKKDVKITLEDGLLTIRGEKKYNQSKDDEKAHRTECFYGSFTRSFRLPENVDDSNVTAKYHNGVLDLVIPKSPNSRPKQIEINVE